MFVSACMHADPMGSFQERRQHSEWDTRKRVGGRVDFFRSAVCSHDRCETKTVRFSVPLDDSIENERRDDPSELSTPPARRAPV